MAGGAAASAILLSLLGGAPFVIPDVWIAFLTGLFLWSAMGIAWSLAAGAGYVSLATAGWYGLGAYSTAVLMNRFELGFPISVVISAVWIAVLAFIVGIPLLRLRSHYFIMGTFIVAEVVQLLMKQARILGLEGGTPVQLPILDRGSPEAFNRYFYFASFGFAILVFAVIATVRRTRMGIALRAIGQDETAAETAGVATVRYKLLVFALSSAVIAAAGGIYAYWVGYIQQETAFSLVVTVKVLIISIIGGITSLVGPVAGAFVVQYIEQVLGPDLADLNQLVYGLIVVAIVLLLPQGLVPGVRSAARRLVARLSRRASKQPRQDV